MAGAVDRSRNLTSGRLEYQFSAGLSGDHVPPPNRMPLTVYLFSGDDWIERRAQSAITRVSYRGSLVVVEEAQQRDGSVHRTAKTLGLDSLKGTNPQNRHPRFAGSFWLTQQRDFVDRHRADFRLAPQESVHGVPCEVCECDVTADEALATFRVRSPLLNTGGVLRVSVAPTLGFVLPLIEVRSPQGDKVLTYESQDWLEFPDHTYFPRQTRMELRAPGGETVFEQFTISPDQINQPIESSEFVITLPAGTSIRDERDPAAIRRETLAEESTTAKIAGVDPGETLRDQLIRWTRDRWWVLGGAVAALLVLMFWWLRSRKRALRQPPI